MQMVCQQHDICHRGFVSQGRGQHALRFVVSLWLSAVVALVPLVAWSPVLADVVGLTAPPTFLATSVSTACILAQQVRASDVNGDGHLDLLAGTNSVVPLCCNNNNNVSVGSGLLPLWARCFGRRGRL